LRVHFGARSEIVLAFRQLRFGKGSQDVREAEFIALLEGIVERQERQAAMAELLLKQRNQWLPSEAFVFTGESTSNPVECVNARLKVMLDHERVPLVALLKAIVILGKMFLNKSQRFRVPPLEPLVMSHEDQTGLGVLARNLINREWCCAKYEPSHSVCNFLRCGPLVRFGIPCRSELWRRYKDNRRPLISRAELEARCFTEACPPTVLPEEEPARTAQRPTIVRAGTPAPGSRLSFSEMQSMTEPWLSAAAQGDPGFLEWWRRASAEAEEVTRQRAGPILSQQLPRAPGRLAAPGRPLAHPSQHAPAALFAGRRSFDIETD
jgi:hypothetical protein